MSEISVNLHCAKGLQNAAVYAEDALRKAYFLHESYAECLQVLMAYPCKLDLEVEESMIQYKAYSILAASKSHKEIAPWAWDCICAIEEALKPRLIMKSEFGAKFLVDASKAPLVQDDLLPRLIGYCEEMEKASKRDLLWSLKNAIRVRKRNE